MRSWVCKNCFLFQQVSAFKIMAANAASSSVLSQRMRSRLQGWRQSILPAFMKKRKNFIVRKGAFESVLGGYGPSQYLPGRNFEAGPPWYRGDEDLPIILTDRVKRFYQEYCGLESPQLEARLCETVRQALTPCHSHIPPFSRALRLTATSETPGLVAWRLPDVR